MKKLTHKQDQQFEDILRQIQTAKQQALQQINKTLVQLYWDIGNYISKQITVANWGKSTVAKLAAFVQKKEPKERTKHQRIHFQQYLANETIF